METPTSQDIRLWASPQLQWAAYGYPAPEPVDDPDPRLEHRIGVAVGELFAATGRTLESIPAAGRPHETSLAQKALTYFTVAEVVGGGKQSLKLAEMAGVKTLSAGSFSRTMFSPAELAGLTGGGRREPPFPPSVWLVLLELMTAEKRAWWREWLGEPRAPATALWPLGGPADDGLMLG